MRKPNTILDFFKRQNAQSSNINIGDASLPTSDILVPEDSPNKSRRVDINAENSLNNSQKVNINEFDISSLEYDHGLHRQIWNYDVNQCDEIRRAYI
jgi:sulfite reductase alpha subunit-like flavoprotein